MIHKTSDTDAYSVYEFQGLHGRYGHWAAKSKAAKRTFVLVYGQHATLERLRPLIDIFRTYGEVYAVDNPGFGGMEPSFQLGIKPKLGYYGEHLRHFANNYLPKNRKLTFIGISFGFQIVTEALQQSTDLQARTEQVISLMGFVQPSDLNMAMSYKLPLVYGLAFPGRTWLGSKLFQLVARRSVIVGAYMISKPIQVKLKNLSRQQALSYANEQAVLWIVNDARTHAYTAWEFINKNDLRRYRLDVDLVGLGVPNDHIINSEQVKRELKDMFKSVTYYNLQLANHAPLDLETEEDIRAVVPQELAKMLESSKNTSKGAS